MCGYNLESDESLRERIGSSPRVRVQHIYSDTDSIKFGIIPACAGTTSAWKCNTISPQDHPRVCGYNAVKENKFTILPGSSPRVRVQLVVSLQVHRVRRIIPACAGTTVKNPIILAIQFFIDSVFQSV